MENSSQFYLIYPLGLSDFGLIELKEKWELYFSGSPCEILSVDEGGILIAVATHQGFLLNNILKTPTRILLRVAEFKARDFPKLFQKISKIPWKQLMLGQKPEVESSSTNSRLFDSRKIEKAIQDGVLESYRKQPVKKKYLDLLEKNKNSLLPKIYYRAVDDLVTISLDTTGELLHKRGEKTLTGLAPIRENLASLLLLSLIQNLNHHSELTLIDPMCGSGTFLMEAHDYYGLTQHREFSYQLTPLWIDNLLFHKIESRPSLPLFSHLLGFEINKSVIEMANKNTGLRKITIKNADLFSDSEKSEQKNVVIINPPYGLRVGEKSEINLEYYKKVIDQIWKKYNPLRLGIIIPEEHHFTPSKEKLLLKLPFKNGGIPVVFYVLGK